jgi:hypothetical protein
VHDVHYVPVASAPLLGDRRFLDLVAHKRST